MEVLVINQWVKNDQMKVLFDRLKTSSDNNLMSINMKNLFRLFNPPFKEVCDCIIITDSDVSNIEKNFDNILKMYMDRTGYEASNTETRINDYFSCEISVMDGLKIAMLLVDNWKRKIEELVSNTPICFILSVIDNHVELRFHKVRKNEKMWLDTDLSKYKDEAIAYMITYTAHTVKGTEYEL